MEALRANVNALLDEVEQAEGRGGPPEHAPWVAIAYTLGRRGLPLSEAPRVRHLLELREKGHRV
jgi:hypothetical protein